MENKAIFKDHEEPKKQEKENKTQLEKFFNSARGPKVFFEDEMGK